MGWRSSYDDDDDDDDLDINLGRHGRPAPKKAGSAGLGIASLVIAVLVGAFLLFMFIGAVVLAAGPNGPPPDNDPKVVALGLSFLGGLVLSVIGVVFGLVGAFQSNTVGTICGILGMVFNAVVLISIAGLICTGLAMGG